VNFYCQDESRFGLFTYTGKGLTVRGVKPVCPFQQVFRYTYLFGAYSPITGDHFELELPYCSTETFQIFLEHFSAQHPDVLMVMQVDNAAFHKAKKLVVPDNIVLMFQPPYSPELNPAEKIWWKMKRACTNLAFENMDQISQFITQQVKALTKETVRSICNFDYYKNAELLWLIS